MSAQGVEVFGLSKEEFLQDRPISFFNQGEGNAATHSLFFFLLFLLFYFNLTLHLALGKINISHKILMNERVNSRTLQNR